MARVTIDLGGTSWAVNTREGGEAEVQRLGAMLAERWPQAIRAAGDGGVPQALLLTALMLADELSEAREVAQARNGTAASVDGQALDQIAEWLETLAETLEHGGPDD